MDMIHIVMAVTFALMTLMWLGITGTLVLIACIHDWRSSRTPKQHKQAEAPAPPRPYQPLGST